MSDTKFRRSERLSGRSELEHVRTEGRRRTLPELVLFFLPGQQDRKFACAATRRVGSAIERNRHRRKLKEFFRLHKDIFKADTHYYALLRQPVADWSDFEKRVRALLSPRSSGGTKGGSSSQTSSG